MESLLLIEPEGQNLSYREIALVDSTESRSLKIDELYAAV